LHPKYLTLLLGLMLITIGSVSALNITPKQIQSKGDILYVGGTGPGNFTRIQDAIDDASSGDTVFVYSGRYYEQIKIAKTLTILGEDKTSTILDGENIPQETMIRLEETSVNSHISGFTLQNMAKVSQGVDISSDGTIVTDILIESNGYYGISVWEADGCRIENCTLDYHGDYLWAYGFYHCKDTLLRNCTSQDGNIDLTTARNIQMLDCKFYNSLYGIKGFTTNLIVRNCEIINPKITGVYLYIGCKNLLFDGCTILNAGDYGMYIGSNSYNITVKDCYIAGTEDLDGIIFWGSGRPLKIINSTFENNGQSGIDFFQGWRGCEITGCRFLNNQNGIETYGELFFFGRFTDNTFINKEKEIWFDSWPVIIGINKFSGNYWSDWSGIGPYHVFGFLNWDFQPRMTPLL